MQTLKLQFCNFWGSFKPQNNMFTHILSRHFNVEISNEPDLLICSNRGLPFEYMKYSCPRLMFMGENMSPDWTVFDYCIGFDFMDFGNRYFRLPLAFYNDDAQPWRPEKMTLEQAETILQEKKYFCNFVYGHPSSHGMRERLFQELEKYKPVISPGSYLHNMDGRQQSVKERKRCTWQQKYEYVKASKFTIAGESIRYPGFATEKITQPLALHSIPIYYGNPNIAEDFNPQSFVECTSEADLESVIEKVRYLDTNDDAYIQMLMECPLHEPEQLVKRYAELEQWLVNICSRSPKDKLCRIHDFCANNHENYLREYSQITRKRNSLATCLASVRKQIRKFFCL